MMRVTPKKRFGQHFLRDSGTLRRILQAIGPASGDLLVEIGPGDGSLTRLLLPKVRRYIGIEIDEECVPSLESLLAGTPKATLVRGDFLELDLVALLAREMGGDTRLRLVGNLPYNAATAMIRRALELPLPLEDLVVMVQLEVAERLTAGSGTKDYGLLSVWAQHRAEVRLSLRVNPACFVPRPAVWSALVHLHLRSLWSGAPGERQLFDLLKAAFAYRRKTILNSLLRDEKYGPPAEAMLQRAGIGCGLRPEQVSVEDYERLGAEYCSVLIDCHNHML